MITPETFDDLLGAYALDAVDADEARAMEEFLAVHPEHEREVERLRAAAAWYGATESEPPPPQLRAAILHCAETRLAGAVAHDAAAEALHQAVARAIDADRASARTVNGLDVRELVVHLVAMESMVCGWAGRSTEPDLHGRDIAGRTREACAAFAGMPLADVVARWDAAARALRGAAEAAVARGEQLPWFGGAWSPSDVLTARAFETWTHAGDIAEATGRARPGLSAAAFGAMAELSMQMLPACLDVRGTTRSSATARLILDGPGGGDWIVPLTPDGPTAAAPSVVLATGVVDWCLRVGDRLAPGELRVDIDGDVELGRELVAAASTFATL